MKITYNAVFQYAEDGVNVQFYDIYNALTCADTREEAILMA